MSPSSFSYQPASLVLCVPKFDIRSLIARHLPRPRFGSRQSPFADLCATDETAETAPVLIKLLRGQSNSAYPTFHSFIRLIAHFSQLEPRHPSLTKSVRSRNLHRLDSSTNPGIWKPATDAHQLEPHKQHPLPNHIVVISSHADTLTTRTGHFLTSSLPPGGPVAAPLGRPLRTLVLGMLRSGITDQGPQASSLADRGPHP